MDVCEDECEPAGDLCVGSPVSSGQWITRHLWSRKNIYMTVNLFWVSCTKSSPPNIKQLAKTPYGYVYTCTCIYIPEGSIASHIKSSCEHWCDRESVIFYRIISAQYPARPLISVLCATFLAFYLRALRHNWICVGGSRKQGLTHKAVMWAPMRLRICNFLPYNICPVSCSSSNISLVCHLFGILPACARSQLNLRGGVSKTRSHTQSCHVSTNAIENL